MIFFLSLGLTKLLFFLSFLILVSLPFLRTANTLIIKDVSFLRLSQLKIASCHHYLVLSFFPSLLLFS